jgi:phosphomannomutase
LGEPLSEELTLAIATHFRLQEKSGVVVTNISTTSAIDQIAGRHGGVVVRTPVGQAYISETMIENEAILGGEGSGGVIVPEVHLTHDSAAAVGLILEGLARSGERISETVRQLPKLIMLKLNLPVEPNRLYSVLQNFHSAIDREQLSYDLTDGIKVVLPEGWVHVRASNTESMIRIIVESEQSDSARHRLDWARDRLKKY